MAKLEGRLKKTIEYIYGQENPFSVALYWRIIVFLQKDPVKKLSSVELGRCICGTRPNDNLRAFHNGIF